MTPKPHRVLINRVSGYASEAAAFMRRRRHTRKPFARVSYEDGRGSEYLPGTANGDLLQAAAEGLIEAVTNEKSNESGSGGT